jgi:glycine cleavage system H protein
MNFPKELRYTKEHEWVAPIQGNKTSVGVSAYAIEHLGDIVHVEFPEVGQNFKQGDSFGTIESTKTVSDCFLPVGGKITEVNTALVDAPEKLQGDAYKNGWLVKIEVAPGASLNHLMDAAAYEKYIAEHKD